MDISLALGVDKPFGGADSPVAIGMAMATRCPKAEQPQSTGALAIPASIVADAIARPSTTGKARCE